MIGTSRLGICQFRTALLSAITLVALLSAQVVAQQGHVVRGNQVLVNQASHWSAWAGAASLVRISQRDGVTPLLVRKDINAAIDAPAFTITGDGGPTVASGQSTRLNSIDGDLTTSWGPDPRSPLSDWWVDLNLGRLVVVQKIVIRFAEEGEGDPFLQFKVLAWRHPPPRSTTKYYLAGTEIPRFWEIGRTSKPSKTQRVFEFDVRSTEGSNDDFVGDPLERIQIIALSTDSTRAAEISAEDHASLPVSRQGAIEHYRQERSGRQTLITEAEYQVIDPERQGPIRYFRREIPRIAEIEVFTAGDNINLGLVDRGGSATIEIGGGDVKDITPTISDGDYSKGHNGSAFDEETYDFLHDLGALFWIDTMHFLTDGGSALDVFSVDISDGTRAPDGSIQYTRVNESSASGNAGISSSTGVRYREIRTAPGKVRYLRSTFANPLNLLSYVGFTEVLLYGSGYVPEVTLTSDLVLLGSTKNLISVDWDADMPQGTRIQLQTRTGNELVEEKIFHDNKGNVITESRYGRLPSSKKGEISSRFEAGPDWSTWSVPYTEQGDEITSPSPRQYLQMRATLITDRADTAATLRSVTLNMSNPVAAELRGEIWPVRVAQVGVAEEFSLFVRPTFTGSGQGFNELKVEATAGTHMELLGLRLGTDAQFESGTATELAAEDLALLSSASDTMHVQLPQEVRQGTQLMELRFRAIILGNSASFRGFVRDTRKSEFWQRVDPGDATAQAASQTVTVLALEGSQVIGDFNIAQSVITPNGDGINDELRVEFSVARVAGERAVTLVIYDLSGRVVARVEELRPDSRGQYSLLWNGQDAAGNLVPPGIYVARVDVAVDSDRAVSTSVQRTIYVAF
jgi:hypothetical protein